MKDCLPSLCFKCVLVIAHNGKIIQHRTSGAYSCSGESLYFKLPSFDKLFAWHWPFLGFASLHFSFVFCICYCELIVFVLFLTCNMMINASHDNALSSLDFHSLLPLISFYHFRGPSLLLGQTGMFGFDLRFALIPSRAVGIESYIFNFIILILLVTIYSLERAFLTQYILGH